jgi:hypothetical protein
VSLEVLLLSWYGGVAAIIGGLALPMGHRRAWLFRIGLAVITASAATMALEFVELPR